MDVIVVPNVVLIVVRIASVHLDSVDMNIETPHCIINKNICEFNT